MKKIEDYLHLHLGCLVFCKTRMSGGDYQTARVDQLDEELLYKVSKGYEVIEKLHLRPLSDMKEDEFIKLLPEFSMDIFNAYNSSISWGDKPKHVLILENRLQTNTLRFNDGIVLLREKYDPFGLIEAGLAIDKTTLP